MTFQFWPFWNRKAPFRSNEEFFQAVRTLIAKLEETGHAKAACELREGFGCLNGLTDGAAQFLEAIEKVRTTQSKTFAPEDRETLEAIRAAVHRAVYRR
jgi:hypothetical protein